MGSIFSKTPDYEEKFYGVSEYNSPSEDMYGRITIMDYKLYVKHFDLKDNEKVLVSNYCFVTFYVENYDEEG